MCIKEKDDRRKLYEENKEEYKKLRADFKYGLSQNSRNNRKKRLVEDQQMEQEKMIIDQEDEANED